MTEIERHTEVTEEAATPAEKTAAPTEPQATRPPAPPPMAARRSYVSRTLRIEPSGAEMARRVIVVIFGIIQVLIGLRIVLLILDAREAHPLVRFILDLSQLFVGPFEGILRTDALRSSGSILDLAAILAFVGWTVLELVVLWIVNVFRREPV